VGGEGASRGWGGFEVKYEFHVQREHMIEEDDKIEEKVKIEVGWGGGSSGGVLKYSMSFMLRATT
jgi:hypothetical protein